jgi:hypothetical protein
MRKTLAAALTALAIAAPSLAHAQEPAAPQGKEGEEAVDPASPLHSAFASECGHS